MRQLTRVTMSMRELDRLKCIQAVIDGELPAVRAAERLVLSSRQVRRLAQRYRLEGPVGLISRHRNRPSNRRLKEALENQLARDPQPGRDLNPPYRLLGQHNLMPLSELLHGQRRSEVRIALA